MRRIPLHGRDGQVRAYAIVDADVFAELGGLAWSLHSEGYAYRQQAGRPRRNVLLHRAVMGLEYGDRRQVDHRDRDRLNCRRGNLRVVPKGANAQNVAANRTAVSAFRGVSPFRGGWQAHAAGRWVGQFVSELDAAIAAEARRREVFPFAEPDPELARVLAELEAVSVVPRAA